MTVLSAIEWRNIYSSFTFTPTIIQSNTS